MKFIPFLIGLLLVIQVIDIISIYQNSLGKLLLFWATLYFLYKQYEKIRLFIGVTFRNIANYLAPMDNVTYSSTNSLKIIVERFSVKDDDGNDGNDDEDNPVWKDNYNQQKYN